MNYVLAFENQKITLYANKKTTPSRDGYMITQIKRSFSLFATISFFAVCFRTWLGGYLRPPQRRRFPCFMLQCTDDRGRAGIDTKYEGL